MAITRVGAVGSDYDQIPPGGLVTITVGASGVGAGSVVIGSFVQSATPTFTSLSDSKGNTWAVAVDNTSGGGSTGRVAIIYGRIVTPLVSGDTITIQMSTTAVVIAHFAEFSGLQTATDPLDKTTSNSNAATLSHTSGTTAATTVADELCFGAFGQCVSPTVVVTKDAAYTQEYNKQNGSIGGMMSEYLIVAATGTQVATATTNSSQGSVMDIATFKGIVATTVPASVLVSPMIAGSW